MIQCVFTLDYEISGNGQGALRACVLEPARRLKALADRHGVKFTVFVEALELARIRQAAADEAIGDVEAQVRTLWREGHEIALHLHPQWSHAVRRGGAWVLDEAGSNLCRLPAERIADIVRGAIAYLREVLEQPRFTPVSFRAGNWLFQPTAVAARVLADHGIRVDSSVFKGGRQRRYGLDYRPALRNGWHWRFTSDINTADPDGAILEIPIHSRMVPCWRLLTSKRLGLRHRGAAARRTMASRVGRWMDFLRLRQPMKLDFCTMTAGELGGMLERVVEEDRRDPGTFRPLVAIGHTKDLGDDDAAGAFLSDLYRRGIGVVTLDQACRRLTGREGSPCR